MEMGEMEIILMEMGEMEVIPTEMGEMEVIPMEEVATEVMETNLEVMELAYLLIMTVNKMGLIVIRFPQPKNKNKYQ